MKNIFQKIKKNSRLFAAFSALLTLLAIGTFVYHYMEDWTWIEALYFTVATLATVGYGDLHPTTDASRLFTVVFIMFGVSVGVAAIASIGGQYLANREEKIIRQQKDEI